MREIELNVVGLAPMCDEEARAVDGGVVPVVAAAIVAGKWLLGLSLGAIAIDILHNPSNTAEQFKEGYDAARK